MASPKLLLLLATFLPSCGLLLADFAPMTLTVVNNCPYPIWPGIQANAGNEVLEGGGFYLPALSHRSFPAPTNAWSGRIWARTGCTPAGAEQLHCVTGDCGGRLQCGGLGGAAPATLAQVSLHGGNDQSSYGVSVVDGFNVGLSVTPHEGRGNCPVLACRKDLTQTCPSELQVRASPSGGVVACKSGCEAFGTDELCCRNAYNSPAACRSSSYSQFFKNECPQASPTRTTARRSPTSAPRRASSRSSSATRVQPVLEPAGGCTRAARRPPTASVVARI